MFDSILPSGSNNHFHVNPTSVHITQISNLYFNTVKIHQVLLHMKYKLHNNINNNKYISEEFLKNTTKNYTKLYLFSMNAVYLT